VRDARRAQNRAAISPNLTGDQGRSCSTIATPWFGKICSIPGRLL
jgi:hypothetical protein